MDKKLAHMKAYEGVLKPVLNIPTKKAIFYKNPLIWTYSFNPAYLKPFPFMHTWIHISIVIDSESRKLVNPPM